MEVSQYPGETDLNLLPLTPITHSDSASVQASLIDAASGNTRGVISEPSKSASVYVYLSVLSEFYYQPHHCPKELSEMVEMFSS